MKLMDDPRIQYEVLAAVAKACGGWDSSPTPDWTIKEMKKCADQDWDNEMVHADNTQDIQKKARAWSRKRGLLRERPDRSRTREVVSTSVGQGFRTAVLLQDEVEQVRLRHWETKDAPFPRTNTGLKQAWDWLQKQKKKEEKQLQGKNPGRAALTVFLDSEDVPALVKFLRPFLAQSSDLPRQLTMLADVLRDAQVKTFKWQYRGGFERGTRHDFYPSLRISGSDGWRNAMKVPANTKLAELAASVQAIARGSRWWTEEQTLTHLMCGGTPVPGIQIGVAGHDATDIFEGITEEANATTSDENAAQQFHQEGNHTNDVEDESEPQLTITLTVRAPTTMKEVARTYERILRTWGLHPKTLSAVQSTVLELVYLTPKLSWLQRYQKWLEWCDERDDLPTYGYSLTSGPASLFTEHRRALRRGSWGRTGHKRD